MEKKRRAGGEEKVREVCIDVAIGEPGSCLHGGQRRFINDNRSLAIGNGVNASCCICPHLLGLWVSRFGLIELTGRALDEAADGGGVIKLAEGFEIPGVEGFDETSCLSSEEIREGHCGDGVNGPGGMRWVRYEGSSICPCTGAEVGGEWRCAVCERQ